MGLWPLPGTGLIFEDPGDGLGLSAGITGLSDDGLILSGEGLIIPVLGRVLGGGFWMGS